MSFIALALFTMVIWLLLDCHRLDKRNKELRNEVSQLRTIIARDHAIAFDEVMNGKS